MGSSCLRPKFVVHVLVVRAMEKFETPQSLSRTSSAPGTGRNMLADEQPPVKAVFTFGRPGPKGMYKSSSSQIGGFYKSMGLPNERMYQAVQGRSQEFTGSLKQAGCYKNNGLKV